MSNNKQSEEEINKIDVQSAADQQENTNADSKKANWRFGAVGNIVKQHLDREGIVRYGTKAFSGGTKVYLDGKGWSLEKDTVAVIGRNRFGRYVIENVPVALVENVRMQRIYKPTVLKIIDREEIEEGWIWWKRTSADKKAAMEFVDAWISKDESGKTRTDLFNECDELEHIIDDLRTGKKTCIMEDDRYSLDLVINWLQSFLEELKDLNNEILAQGNTPELLKKVYDRYTEIWLLMVKFSVIIDGLQKVVVGLWQYPNYYNCKARTIVITDE